MPFLDEFNASLGSGLGAGAAGIAAASLGGGASDRDVRKGLEYENRFFARRDIDSYNRAVERGLTPQEYYGSPAPGGSGATGATQVLGQAEMQKQKVTADMAMMAYQKGQDRATAIKQTEIQAKSAQDVAQINAGQSDINNQRQVKALQDRLSWDKSVFQKTTLPQAAQLLKLTEQQTLKAINDVATSTPKFVRFLTIMKMGIDNMLGLASTNALGIDISDTEQMKNLSAEKRQKLIAGLLAAKSHMAAEYAGATQNVHGTLDSLRESLAGILNLPYKFIEATESKEKGPTLGRRNSEPYQSGPNMNYR